VESEAGDRELCVSVTDAGNACGLWILASWPGFGVSAQDPILCDCQSGAVRQDLGPV
jgi:hypothetical protein